MSLSVYNTKRHFSETPEPQGKTKSSKGSLRFVIQKHDASHLHYDLRLEMEGVLKSWAVPKGPSLNPADKRLAMMVEDHPFDYRNFEGIIPEGNYGAGTVIVWDEGTYEPMEGENLSRKEKEKLLLHQLHSGNIKLVFHGKKLKGEYALFLMKGRGDRSWILMKKNDDFATEKDITELNTSVKSGKTLAQVAEENGTTPNHPENEKEKKKEKEKSPPIQLLDDVVVNKKKRSAASGIKKSTPVKPVKAKTAANKTAAKTTSKKIAVKTAVKKTAAKTTVTKKTGSKTSKKKIDPEKIEGFPGEGLPSSIPSPFKPMLATLVDEPFNSDEWIFEIKWDGYRALAFLEEGEADLVSRNLQSFTSRYTPVKDALEALGINAVFDGEIVAVNQKGMADFQLLQNWQNAPVELRYYIFDLVWLNGYDLSSLPLIDRKKILRQVIPPDHEVLRFSDHVETKGEDFFKAALKQGLEGIMAKRADSLYEKAARTKDWVKIKVNLRQEVVIAGFTEPRNSRKHFGSLLLGVYDGNELVYIGHTGGGFNNRQLDEIYKKLRTRIVEKSPFKKIPKTNMPATWVKPDLVCEIKFTEWTKDRIARHPIFMGLREDKKPKEVRFEKATNMNAALKKPGSEKEKVTSKKSSTAKGIAKTAAKKKAKPKGKTGKTAERRKAVHAGEVSATLKPTPPAAKKSSAKSKGKVGKVKASSPGQLDLSAGNDQQIVLNGNELKLTNLTKPYWKKEKFLKGDVINYYLRVMPYIFPYLEDRPQSLNRHPNGIDAPNFFMKDTKGKVPDWVVKHIDFSESTNKNVEYMVCANEASLIYMANLGCIEINPWHARSQSWEFPDWCLIDLDPDKTNSFEQVIDTALAVKEVLDQIGAESCVKTSGSSGIHIYIPLGAQYSYEQSRQLAELIVTVVNQQMPELTSIIRNPAKRKGKIYLDFLQNRETQTAASPYSLRPKPGVPVSTPLDWTEVKKGLTPKTWHAKNIFERLKTEGDLFRPVLGKGINMAKVLEKLGDYLR